MGKYLAPLGIFAGGMIVALFLFLFLGTIGNSADQLAADSAGMASTFWNWELVSGAAVKFVVVILVLLLTLYATAKSFLKVR